MELPERIWITEGRVKSLTCGVYWTSPAECPVEDDVEYIRSEAVKRLVEAAKVCANVLAFTCNECPRRSECAWEKNECEIAEELKAALAAVEG